MQDNLFKTPAETAPAPLRARLLRLAVGLGIIWLIVFVLAPLPFKYSATMRGLKESAEALGIHPGSVYYTDVPTSGRAERNTREAVRLAGLSWGLNATTTPAAPPDAAPRPGEQAPRNPLP